MKQHQPSHQGIGRRTRLATCLGMALALGAGSALAANPEQARLDSATTTQQNMLTRGVVSGQATLPSANTPPFPNAAAQTNAVNIISVSNCNNSGVGSLRSAVGQAVDGDTNIVKLTDVSGDCTIELLSSIVTSVDDLTIQGKTDSKYPIISGQDTVRPIRHSGAGTLTLMDTDIRNGLYTSSGSRSPGGCVRSSGNVKLIDSRLKYCHATNDSFGVAKGGAVFSDGNVSLQRSSIVNSSAENTGTGYASGGGIYARGNVSLGDSSIVASNEAVTSGDKKATGGGIWSHDKTTIDGQSVVDSNEANALGSGRAQGGGIRSFGELAVTGNSAITGNTAKAATSSARGGGAWARGVVQVKYSQIEDNVAETGSGVANAGGLHTSSNLITKYSTIANNEAASFGGGGLVGGDVNIQNTTISGNTAQRVGGLFLSGDNATQPLQVIKSTVSGNVATGSVRGAGIFAGYDIRITNSTITGNIESNPDDLKYGAGLSVKEGATADLSSTIISGNILKYTDDTETPSDIGAARGNDTGTVLSGDYNLIGFTSFNYPGSHGIQSFSPGLEALADNGGLTWTHAVQPGSPALDAGVSNSSTTDQRGTGFKRTVGAAPDIGAFERGGDRIFADGFE